MEKMEEQVELLLKNNRITKQNRIVLFGANKSSMMILKMLDEYNVVAIIDNDIRKRGQVINNIRVYNPEEYLRRYNQDIRVIIASEYYAQMCEQLEEMGYKKGKEVYVVWHGNRYYDVSDETFEYHVGRARRGLKIYQSLVEKYNKPYIFICPYAGTGDIYIIGLYLKDYAKKQGIKKFVVIIPGMGCCKVAELFDLPYINMEQEQIEELVVFVRIAGLKKTNSEILNDSFLQVMVKRMRGYKDVDFHTMFQKCVFGAEEKISVIKIKQTNSDILFEKNGLIKGKTILISPYANTITKLPELFWEKLVMRLQQEGYVVCTNSIGENEPPIRGTQGIFIPYNQCIDFLDKAGGFIGVRSGLCDIISSTKAKMVVLYPYGNIFGSCSTFDYFSLKKMKFKCTNLSEIICKDLDDDNLIDSICDEFIKERDLWYRY